MFLLTLTLVAESASLSLICTGFATTQVIQSTDSALAFDNFGNSVTANNVRTSPDRLALTTRFEMADGSARVFLPAEMRPEMSSTKDGWFSVSNLTVTDSRITGKVKLSFIRSTTIEIDRTTGVLVTKHGFQADCQPVDRSQRKF